MSSPTSARAAAPEVTVVMPAHNEAGYIDDTLSSVVGALRDRMLTFEVLVVENGSSDSTYADASKFASAHGPVCVMTRPTADYGAAMRDGILAATGEVVIVFDVDYFDPAFIDDVLPRLTADDGPVLVVGSKRAPGTRDGRPWVRRAITAGFSTVLRYGFGVQVSDTHGMKAMRRAELVPIARDCRNGTDLFDTELVLRADRAGLRVAEVPVTVEERRPSRTPISRRIARTIVGLVRLRLQLWREDRRLQA
jgi:glycosyltransferase involved in cell wall biosynthesis